MRVFGQSPLLKVLDNIGSCSIANFTLFQYCMRCSWLLRYSPVLSSPDSISHKVMKPPRPFAMSEWFRICYGAKALGSPVGRIGFPSLSSLQRRIPPPSLGNHSAFMQILLVLHKRPIVRISVEFKRLCDSVSLQSFTFLADESIDKPLEVWNFFNKMRNHRY
jgi:hypothetical protein